MNLTRMFEFSKLRCCQPRIVLVYIYNTNYKLISSRKWLLSSGLESHNGFLEPCTLWYMIELNLTTKVKYSTLHRCQLWNISSIYTQTTSGSGLEPHMHFFRRLNTTCMEALTSHRSSKWHTFLLPKLHISLVYIEQLKLDQLMKIINMFRFGTRQPFFFDNWTQWYMKDLQLTPHFKYITVPCCQSINIFSIYIPTRAILVHKND